MSMNLENYNSSTYSNVEIVNCEAEGINGSLNVHHQKTAEGFVPPPPQNVPMESKEYQRYLKARLHFECAALASVRDKHIDLGVSISSKPGDPSQETLLKESDKVEAATKNGDSAASAQQSKRRLLNRDSAQRSRKRKSQLISELEARVSKLEEENSNLLKQRVDNLQRHNQTLRDNAFIKEQVAELRSQVYVLEEKLKNVPASRHMSPALNCNRAGGSAQDNVLIRQYPSQANTLLSGHGRHQSSMTCPLIPNSNNINDVTASSGSHDHRQSSLVNPPITNRNLDMDNDLDAWLKTANTLLSGHDRRQSLMTCPLIPNTNINDVNASSGQSSLANRSWLWLKADRDIDNDLDAWLKAQQHNP